MFDLKTEILIQQKVREELTLKEKVLIANEEENNFTKEEKDEIESHVQDYFQQHFNFEKIEKAKKEFREYV